MVLLCCLPVRLFILILSLEHSHFLSLGWRGAGQVACAYSILCIGSTTPIFLACSHFVCCGGSWLLWEVRSGPGSDDSRPSCLALLGSSQPSQSCWSSAQSLRANPAYNDVLICRTLFSVHPFSPEALWEQWLVCGRTWVCASANPIVCRITLAPSDSYA